MSGNGSFLTTNAEAAFPSLAALKVAHLELLERRSHNGETPAVLAAIAAFIARGCATGTLLDADNERWASQSVLDYWANVLYRAGRAPGDATLAEFDPALAPELPDEQCPYVGLNAFDEAHHGLFFGRRRGIKDFVQRLAEQRLLLVVGPSGSGKSSLVLGGLLPALKSGGLPDSATWRYQPVIVPGSEPLRALARLVDPQAGAAQIEEAIAALRNDPAYLAQQLARADSRPILLVVDQFEELFTLCGVEADRQVFSSSLAHLVQTPGARHTVVLTMRSDFETWLARLWAFEPWLEQALVRILPLSAAELREAIQQPAAAVGLKLESGVVEGLLQDVLGEPAALPLLQWTLLQLWEQRDHNRVTLDTYQRLGGGRLALATSADAFYSRLIPEDQVTTRRILLRMVRPGDGFEVTSQRVRRAALYQNGEAPDRIDRVLTKLIRAHLVRLTHSDTPADAQVEVAHEALVRNWPRLVGWLEDERAALTTRRRLEAKAAEWARLGRGSSELLDDVQLLEAERWLSSADAAHLGYDATLPQLISASRARLEATRRIAASRQLELARAQAEAGVERQRAHEQRRLAKRTRRFAAVLLMLLVFTVLTTVFAFSQRQIVQRQLVIADAQRIALAAQNQIADAPETALLLAREAFLRDRNPVTEQALRDALDQVNWQPTVLRGHTDDLLTTRWSADGQRVLTAGNDGTARLWDQAGRLIRTLSGHTAAINSAVFSPDGQRVLTAANDGTARLWDVAGQQLAVFTHDQAVNSAIFSPDGQRILTASNDRTARVWAATGQPLAVLRGHTDGVNTAVFSPDGQRILTASRDATARLWDSAGKSLTILQGHTAWVNGAVFTPDGQQVLTTARDKTAMLWSISGQPLATLRGHTDWVWGNPVFSPDGQRILTASQDGTARLWDMSGTLLTTFTGHTDGVNTAVFSPDGQRILTGSQDQTARLWDVAGKQLDTLSQTGRIMAVAFSPDGQRVLTAGRDDTARIWTYTGPPAPTLRGHTDWAKAAYWSADGQRVLTISRDRTARLWSAAGAPLATLRGHTDELTWGAISPDGQFLLTGARDQTARLWDASGNERAVLRHDDVVTRVAFSPDGQRILTASRDGAARLWDLSGALLVTFTGHTDAVWSAVFSPDGQYVLTASQDRSARLWNLSGQLLATFNHDDAVQGAVFSPDGRSVATASNDKTARLWALDGTLRTTFLGHTDTVWREPVFSPDGQRILTASRDQTARLWDVSGKQLAVLPHAGRVQGAVFSPDGQRILTAATDKRARLWDASGRLIATLTGHTDFVNTAAFSPDGRRILTAANDGTARLYLVDAQELVATVGCRVGRGFTADEIERYQLGALPNSYEQPPCAP